VLSVIAAQKAKTRQSIPNWIQYGASMPNEATMARLAHRAMVSPIAPPATPSVRLSASTSRTMRPRVQPIATRIEISRCRSEARTSSRLLTLAQAISRTNATAPSSTADGAAVSSIMSSCSERTRTDHWPFVAACSAATAAPMPRISPAAAAVSTPGCRRATIPSDRSVRFWS
jgi:hypothetical protein